ncbi:MAG: hypothetical protein AAGG38_04470 [Planctomycetota bacterium]
MDNRQAAKPATAKFIWVWSVFVLASVLSMVLVLPWIDRASGGVEAWFMVPVLWMLLAVPATLGVYGSCFRDRPAGDGDTPAPRADRMRGMMSVWGVLTAGVVLSVLAGLVGGSVTPAIWPGALMLMLLVLARPA